MAKMIETVRFVVRCGVGDAHNGEWCSCEVALVAIMLTSASVGWHEPDGLTLSFVLVFDHVVCMMLSLMTCNPSSL